MAAEQSEIDFLRLSEIPRYLEACPADFCSLAEVLIACGLRISEALALTWTDVDLAGSVVLVTGSRAPDRARRGRKGSSRGHSSMRLG